MELNRTGWIKQHLLEKMGGGGGGGGKKDREWGSRKGQVNIRNKTGGGGG